MKQQNVNAAKLSEITGKKREHIEAVLAGYPNSVVRPTPLDTVGDLAAAMGYQLDLTPIERGTRVVPRCA